MVNIDASFTKDGQTEAWGTVIKYHDCLIVCLAGTSYCTSNLQPWRSYLCLEGPNMALAISSNNLILETECVSVM
jgi:hypothetical protein